MRARTCIERKIKTKTEREAPDIAPIEGDPEARDQLCVQTVLTKHKIYNTLKTRTHKELIYLLTQEIHVCAYACGFISF